MVQNQTRQIKVAWQPWNAQANGVMWSTSNENIAVVDANGFVTAVSEGDAVITATGQVWDPYHWDNETGTTVPAWVDYSSECKIKVVKAEDALYGFVVEDFSNIATDSHGSRMLTKHPLQ